MPTLIDFIKLGDISCDNRIFMTSMTQSRAGAGAAPTGMNADAISFRRSYLANADLVERFKTGTALAKLDFKTLYTPGPKGYVD